ncbi:inosine monophosphate dehydrogenase [Xylaria acuta]|nr:inosine monophosphate dehydrogenase [Xylaria acuta]
MASKLRADYPWTTSPVIINAPMAGFAGAPLATAVTASGGIGMIGIVNDTAALEAHLEDASKTFSSSSSPPPSSSSSLSTSTSPASSASASAFYQETHVLPIGVGLLLFALKTPDAVLPALRRHPPALLWLFAAPALGDYAVWTTALRAALPPTTKIWIQVGTASAALEVARSSSSSSSSSSAAAAVAPDVIVLQGSDAGGHGFARGASLVSLLPETTALFAEEEEKGLSSIPIPLLVAAGGIVDGRGVAAALSLGAAGVVMGTAFLAAHETALHPAYRAAVLAARDGATATARATVFDELRGPSVWPALYDGRALATESYRDWRSGTEIEVLRARVADAAREGEGRGFAGGRAPVWAGAGVGLVNEVRSAGQIVEAVRDGARTALRGALAGLGVDGA